MERHHSGGTPADVELYARAGAPVLVGDTRGAGGSDAGTLALPEDLVTALHEWARVVQAGDDGGDREVRLLASSRGRQLATRVAGHAGVVVGYTDPVEGGLELIGPGTDAAAEPIPWATGLTISAVAATIALLTLVGLADAMASWWLSALVAVLVAAGLAPSIWLLRVVPVWRWVAYGVAAGIGGGWLVLLLSLLG